jgi:hypothetical protein
MRFILRCTDPWTSSLSNVFEHIYILLEKFYYADNLSTVSCLHIFKRFKSLKYFCHYFNLQLNIAYSQCGKSTLPYLLRKTMESITWPFEPDNFLFILLISFLSLSLSLPPLSLSRSYSRWLRFASTIRLDITYGCCRVCFADNPRRITPSTRLPRFWPSISHSYTRKLRDVISAVYYYMTAEFLTLCNVRKASALSNLCGCARNIIMPNLVLLCLPLWQCALNTEVVLTK